MNKDANFFASNIRNTKSGMNFKISSKFIDKDIEINTFLEGEHNIKNILASYVIYHCLNKNPEDFAAKLNSKAMELTKAAIVLKPNKNLENKIREFSFLFCTNSKIYLKISKKAYSICDGNGIERVINHLNQNEQKLS